jgi:hypothetical protein
VLQAQAQAQAMGMGMERGESSHAGAIREGALNDLETSPTRSRDWGNDENENEDEEEQITAERAARVTRNSLSPASRA